jgi:GDPmannose 4,6-dehydratase
MNSKKALISGVTGQDGAYLAKLLLSKGYKVFGTFRRTSTPNFWRLQYADVYSKINLIPADLTDMGSLINAMKISDPDEVYNMAAMSFVRTAFEQPVGNSHSTGTAVTRFLESIKAINPNVKFYQASSSEMFGNSNTQTQNEQTSFSPASPYGAAKLYAHWITKVYQEAYDMFAVSGILFNHESPIRGLEFVTRKITNAAVQIKLGLKKDITVGNLKSKRDWGYAPEYMEAIYLMMQQDKPETYVISTNEAHSVEELAKVSFEVLNLDWKDYVKTDKKYNRPLDINLLKGDYSKAKNELGWEPKTKFHELIKLMVNEDLKRWTMFLDGKVFPWDAPLYPDEMNILQKKNESEYKF